MDRVGAQVFYKKYEVLGMVLYGFVVWKVLTAASASCEL